MKDMILSHKTILFTGKEEINPQFNKYLEKHGADVIHFPTIKIIPVKDYSYFDSQIIRFAEFDFLIFSSTNGVRFFCNRISELKTILNYNHVKIIAVGTATADECRKNKIPVDIIPNEFSARGIINTLIESDIANKNILIPSSSIARDELKISLTDAGANVFTPPVYDNIIPSQKSMNKITKRITKKKPSLFVFTSPSTFNNFINIMMIDNIKNYFSHSDIAAIGPVTAAAIEKHGLRISIIPDKFTMNSLAEKIVKFYNN